MKLITTSHSILRFLFVLASVAFLCSCGGGGGGGGGFVGAANVSIQISPRSLDSGDRTLVEIQVSEVHPDGISLKVRYPTGLRYIAGSSFIEVDGDSIDIDPGDTETVETSKYVVYYLPLTSFSEDGRGKVSFQLEAISEVTDGLIEVDADADSTQRFDKTNPEFAAQDQAEIEVVD